MLYAMNRRVRRALRYIAMASHISPPYTSRTYLQTRPSVQESHPPVVAPWNPSKAGAFKWLEA